MRRREFIKVIAGSAVAWPLTTHAQQSDQRRIGVLMVDAENDPEGQSHAKAIRDGLQKLGWTAERNIRFDYRWAAGDAGRIRAFAKELVAMQPDVILARSTPATAALKAETRTIPIVFTTVSDPLHITCVRWKPLLNHSRWRRSRLLFMTTPQSRALSRRWRAIRMAD